MNTLTRPTSELNLIPVLAPKSVAVVGASRKAGSVGEAVFSNLLHSGYQGVVYPVNPKAASISGVKCYPSLSDIGDPIDLAVIIVPSHMVPATLKECGDLKIPGAIIITAGFKEIGGEGIQLEQDVIRIANENNIALVGPNCLGYINTDPAIQLNASFAATMPKEGNIAFISQSGALCTAVLDFAKGKGIGFSKFISMGNKAVVNEVDLLRALKNDPLTKIILLYVEDISDGKAFIETAREITGEIPNPKPIIAIKSGRTREGAAAASSHTGSLAGSDDVYDAIFLQSGVLRVETVEELFDYGVAFSQQPLPKGNKIAIVTNAGGPGIMATDAAIRHGLQLAALSEETIKELASQLPPTANLHNPIDVIGDARHDRYEAAIKSVLKDPNVDGVVVILTPQAMTNIEEIGHVVADAKKSSFLGKDKPILASFMGIVDVSKGTRILEENGIPHYTFPEAAVRALAQMHKYRKSWLDRPRTEVKIYPVNKPEAEIILQKVKSDGRTYLPEVESLSVFSSYGFPTLKSKISKSEEEAIRFAEELGFPVVMKIVSPSIVHKLDVGGVMLNLRDKSDIEKAFRTIMANALKVVDAGKIWGVEVQQMAGPGLELFLGAKRDPKFGPLIAFGLGGTFVEVFRDVTFRLAPLREWTTRAMMEQSRAAKILHGYRGLPLDVDCIAESLSRLSQLITDFPEIQELDINPFIVYPKGKGAVAVDGRIALKP